MNRSEFDKFANEYRSLHAANISVSGENPEYFAEYKVIDVKNLLGDAQSKIDCRILDFGAGIGASLPFFRKHLPTAHVTSIDVSLESLKIGASRVSGDSAQVAFDGARLPFADGTFDCVFAACVFHHISEHEHERLFGEMRRVLRIGGRLVIFEHNPCNPLTVRAVDTCEFDANAVLIRAGTMKSRLHAVGFDRPKVRYRIFFPRALCWLRIFERALAWLPLGAQYYVCSEK